MYTPESYEMELSTHHECGCELSQKRYHPSTVCGLRDTAQNQTSVIPE